MADDLVDRIRGFARSHDVEVVSSAYLSRQLQVDVRTIAAALRRHDVRARDVGSARGYAIAELVSVGLPSSYAPDDEPLDAVAVLSAGAGHDMTPALRAAGML